MVNVNEAVIARLKKGSSIFELFVDCDRALAFREGKNIPLDEVIVAPKVFKDAKKGEHASENELLKVFKTSDVNAIVQVILKEGDVQLTTEHKARLREMKRKELVNLIHVNAIDPKTGHPHPPQRIEAAMEQAKVKVDEMKSAYQQMESAVRKLTEILPLRLEIRNLEVRIPAKYAASSFHLLKDQGKLLSNEWTGDGSLLAVLELPAGLQEKLEDTLNKVTKGEVQIKVVNRR
ncbi:ribosome assembly factor SBDS [Candidatus Woesearchaeota archaeon]|nr:ribosome assembly factor SBDS [Candidatus Woesearchaeota archaeon]